MNELTASNAQTTADSYHHGDLRNSLINAAVNMIEQHGAANLTMRGLARQVGVSHAAPYRHFAGLDDVLVAAGAQGFA